MGPRPESTATQGDGLAVRGQSRLTATGHILLTADSRRALRGWGRFAPAITGWERITGRAAPVPAILDENAGPAPAPAFVEWLMGLPAGWITDPVLGLTHSQQLTALGNGAAPSQAVGALTALLRSGPRQRAGQDVIGLVHHSNRSVRYRAIRYTQRRAEAEAAASVGSGGDSNDNAMAEALNSLFKTECIRNSVTSPKSGWKSVGDVAIATHRECLPAVDELHRAAASLERCSRHQPGPYRRHIENHIRAGNTTLP